MKQRRTIVLTLVLLVLLVVPLVLMMWPDGPLDLSKDEEPFNSMVLPPKSVIAVTYMDHGSAAMRLIDQKDVEYWITFPINYDGLLDSHSKAYQGEINGKMVLLKTHRRAKAITVRLVRDYAREDEYGCKKIVLRALTHRTIPFRIQRFFE